MHSDTLENHQYLISQIAKIYLQEWSWHYADEWNIHTQYEMEEDIKLNYLPSTLVAFDVKKISLELYLY